MLIGNVGSFNWRGATDIGTGAAVVTAVDVPEAGGDELFIGRDEETDRLLAMLAPDMGAPAAVLVCADAKHADQPGREGSNVRNGSRTKTARWVQDGWIIPAVVTAGGQFRFDLDEVREQLRQRARDQRER